MSQKNVDKLVKEELKKYKEIEEYAKSLQLQSVIDRVVATVSDCKNQIKK